MPYKLARFFTYDAATLVHILQMFRLNPATPIFFYFFPGCIAKIVANANRDSAITFRPDGVLVFPFVYLWGAYFFTNNKVNRLAGDGQVLCCADCGGHGG